MEGMTVEDGRRELRAHIEAALDHVDVVEKPVVEDSTPVPCFDDLTKAPDMGKASIDFVVPVEWGKSYESAERMRDGLDKDGWIISTNTGAPDDQLMFSASKGDYHLLVSGSKGNIGRLVVGGSSPCFPKGSES